MLSTNLFIKALPFRKMTNLQGKVALTAKSAQSASNLAKYNCASIRDKELEVQLVPLIEIKKLICWGFSWVSRRRFGSEKGEESLMCPTSRAERKCRRKEALFRASSTFGKRTAHKGLKTEHSGLVSPSYIQNSFRGHWRRNKVT